MAEINYSEHVIKNKREQTDPSGHLGALRREERLLAARENDAMQFPVHERRDDLHQCSMIICHCGASGCPCGSMRATP